MGISPLNFNDSNLHPHRKQRAVLVVGRLTLLVVLLVLPLMGASEVYAQRNFIRSTTKEYPARPNVHLSLKNRSGTITVEGWDRNKIKVTAEMEAPTGRFTPDLTNDGLTIDVVRENRGREDIGDINFRIFVPVNSTVNLETGRGQIKVTGIQGAMVRAIVSSEGDIDLIGIRASKVVADSLMGNIVFDAELQSGGIYELSSVQGDINLRISANSGFQLSATARNIDLGGFKNQGDFRFLGGNRKVVGKVGEGKAALSTTLHRGTISFMPR